MSQEEVSPDVQEAGREQFSDDREFELYRLRHSSAHVLAQAMLELYPGTRLGNGPPVKDGFYYDFLAEQPLGPEELAALEIRMQEIVKRRLPIVRREVTRDEALELFGQRGQTLKVERIRLLGEDAKLSVYSQGEFADLCKGPHVAHTGLCRHVKLTSVAGAYWLNDARNPQLQRVYGTAWPSAEELKAYLERVEQARLRDHRKLGRQLELFLFHEYSPGAAFWLPKGAIVYNLLGQKMRELLLGEGYVEVKTPLVFDKHLWEISGHWEHYKDDMFRVTSEEREFGLKPMNCPSHMLIYRSRQHSYRDLPLRIHDQGVLHRNELSGAIGGLTRVRQFCQDDAHIFLPEAEIEAEIHRLIALVRRVYDPFGMKLAVNLSTRPDSFLGEPETWNRAEAALAKAIEASGFQSRLRPGEGTFYGPKIDFDATDALGREFQCATIQLDFQLPRRFELTYVGEDNKEHVPVVIHRAIFGSFERFIGILIEHYAGAFPLWLAPVQCRVMTVGLGAVEYGQSVVDALRQRGLRVEFDQSDSTVSAKVREAQVMKVPVGIVVGGKEVENRTVTLRRHGTREQKTLALDEAVEMLAGEAQFAF